MASIIRIFDHFCKPLVQFNHIPATPRSWLLNDYGKCEFSIGFNPSLKQSAQICREQYLQFGNLVHIEHIPSKDLLLQPKGKLPDWVGIILPNRDWDLGICHVTAYQAEAILAFRAMPYQSVKGSPADVFIQILNMMTAKNIIFQNGIIDNLNITVSDDLRTNIYDHIKKMVKNAGMDWNITSEIDSNNGSLKLYANLYQRKGIDTNFILTNKNTELSSPLLSEQGTPSNHIFGYSQAQTAQSRIMTEVFHQGSYDDYGPLELNQVIMGAKDSATVMNATQQRVDARGRPVKLIKRIVLDKDKSFSNLDVGNSVYVKDNRVGFNKNGGYGFEGNYRIISMDYNDLSNKVPLNIMEM